MRSAGFLAVLAGVLASLAVLSLWPPPRLLSWLRGREEWSRPLVEPRVVVAVVSPIVVVSLVVLGLPLAPLILSMTGLGVAVFAARGFLAARRHMRDEAESTRVVEIVDVLSSALQAGLTPEQAIERAAQEFHVLEPVRRAVVQGHRAPVALRQLGSVEPRAMLSDVAAAWEVADRTGSPLAEVLTKLAGVARAELDVRREVATSAAPARATGRLLAALPLFALLLGSGLGTDPVRLLTTNPLAAASMAVGAMLSMAGVTWIDRLVVAAGR